MIGEKTRLYQAALEERRFVRAHADELLPHEAVEALGHMDHEVAMAHREMATVWLEANA